MRRSGPARQPAAALDSLRGSPSAAPPEPRCTTPRAEDREQDVGPQLERGMSDQAVSVGNQNTERGEDVGGDQAKGDRTPIRLILVVSRPVATTGEKLPGFAVDGHVSRFLAGATLPLNADNRGGVTSLLRTHFFRQTGQFSMVFTASDVCGASPNQQALRTFCLLRASFPPPSF